MPPVPEPQIDVDQEVVLAEWRRQQAFNRQAEAVNTELNKRQYQKLAAANPEHPGVEQQRIFLESLADDRESKAVAMHALAGTTKDEAKTIVLQTLQSQRFHFQQQYLGAQDAASHPEAYGNINNDPALWACGLEALDEIVAEVEAWGPAQPQGKAKGGKK